jgi:hypothetical protein
MDPEPLMSGIMPREATHLVPVNLAYNFLSLSVRFSGSDFNYAVETGAVFVGTVSHQVPWTNHSIASYEGGNEADPACKGWPIPGSETLTRNTSPA